MKKNVVLLLTSLALTASTFARQPIDTTIVLSNHKQINISDRDKQLDIRVIEQDEQGNTSHINEIYINNKDYSIRTATFHEGERIQQSIVRENDGFLFSMPSLPWNRQFDPHWAGFGIGFNNVADKQLHINHVNGVSLYSGASLEYTLNLFEKSFVFGRNHWAFVTGLGMKWNRYHLSKNEYFIREGDQTVIKPAEDIRFYKTRLGVNSFTLPLLLEYQAGRTKAGCFFLSAGVVGSLNYMSASKVKYVDERGRKQKERIDRELYVRLFSFDILVQAGFGSFGLYAKYSPVTLFEPGRGPEVYSVSVGAMIHF